MGIFFKIYWWILIIGLIGILLSCGNSPTKDEDREQNIEQPDLTNMVFIPAGEFLMGSFEDEGAFDEHPQHKVYLDDFYIDKYEVTNAQFKEFVESTGYVTDAERKGYGIVWNPKALPNLTLRNFENVNWQCPNAWIDSYGKHPDSWEQDRVYEEAWGGIGGMNCPADQRNYPVVQVSWNDAQAYATWVGKRLPTEAEWENAARGTDGRLWPWGNVFNLDIKGVTVHTNIASDYLSPVDSFPTGVSLYGIYNMAGNVQEWVADWYAGDYYAHSPKNNPKGPDSGIARVLKGGSWRHQKSHHVLSANRAYQVPDYSSNFVGFRCAWNKSMIGQRLIDTKR